MRKTVTGSENSNKNSEYFSLVGNEQSENRIIKVKIHQESCWFELVLTSLWTVFIMVWFIFIHKNVCHAVFSLCGKNMFKHTLVYFQSSYVEKLNILSLTPLIQMDLNLDVTQNVAFKIPLKYITSMESVLSDISEKVWIFRTACRVWEYSRWRGVTRELERVISRIWKLTLSCGSFIFTVIATLNSNVNRWSLDNCMICVSVYHYEQFSSKLGYRLWYICGRAACNIVGAASTTTDYNRELKIPF